MFLCSFRVLFKGGGGFELCRVEEKNIGTLSEYRNYAIHNRTIFSNFSLFDATNFQGFAS